MSPSPFFRDTAITFCLHLLSWYILDHDPSVLWLMQHLTEFVQNRQRLHFRIHHSSISSHIIDHIIRGRVPLAVTHVHTHVIILHVNHIFSASVQICCGVQIINHKYFQDAIEDSLGKSFPKQFYYWSYGYHDG